MSSKVRVGIVGTSGWTDFMYLSSLKDDPQTELAALCGGHNRQRAEELAAKYQIPGVYLDYREMLAKGGLDAVIVASPDDLHHPIVLDSLRAGLHVLCDKPLAVTAQQAREMYEAAEAAKVIHMTLFTYRWMPFFRYVRDLLDQGVVGKPYHCEFRYEMGYARQSNYAWRLDQQRANGVLADLGSHTIDLAHWLVGDITRVSARLGVFVQRQGADGGPLEKPANDSAFLLTEFANGAQGSMHASVVAHLGDRFMQQQVKLYGENGSLELDMQYEGAKKGAVIRVARGAEKNFETLEIPAGYWGSADPAVPFSVFAHQPVGSREFIAAIQTGQPVTPSFKEGYRAQQVIEAALLADQTGKWVNVSEM